MERDACRPSCLHRPSGLPFCLSAPRDCTQLSPFSNGNGTGPCWGPSAASTLSWRRISGQPCCVCKVQLSEHTQLFLLAESFFCLGSTLLWKRRLFSGPLHPLQSGPSAPVSPHETKMIKTCAPLGGRLLESRSTPHINYRRNILLTATRPCRGQKLPL